ncbi:MAG: hypothetical protein V1749_12530 [Candidatus Desantisbacteria bacterium]
MLRHIIWVLLFIFCIVPEVWAEKIITIVSPSVSITQGAEQTIKGIVARSSVKKISLVQEVFLSDGDKRIEPLIIPVENGKFQGSIILSPGLNIITIKTLDTISSHETFLPIFLTHPKKKIIEKRFGKTSPIVFTSPEGVKFNTTPVIKGVVTDPLIKEIIVVMMNLPASLLLSNNIESESYIPQTIICKKVAVKNMSFSFLSTLDEGPNIILAKPSSPKATIETIQYKVMVCEKESMKIYLDAPELEKNKVIIAGKVLDDSIKNVNIKIYALVEDIKEDREYLKTITEKTIKVNNDGTFKMTAQLENNRYIIKSSPTIVVTSGKERATKTLIKWW